MNIRVERQVKQKISLTHEVTFFGKTKKKKCEKRDKRKKRNLQR